MTCEVGKSMNSLWNHLHVASMFSVDELEDMSAHAYRAQYITARKCRARQKEKFERMLKKRALFEKIMGC